MKAGIMEIADVFAVNKSDREGAALLAAEIKITLTVSEETLCARSYFNFALSAMGSEICGCD